MDSLTAFAIGEANRHRELMVFDWEKAAKRILETIPKVASAGLQGDWEWTSGYIFKDSKPVPSDETYVYLASTWATPELELDGVIEECYKMESETPGWDADTYWPEEALKILGLKVQ